MHYGSTAFGGGRRTIEAIDSKNQRLIGQRGGFSEIDIKQINLMYCSEFFVNLFFKIFASTNFWQQNILTAPILLQKLGLQNIYTILKYLKNYYQCEFFLRLFEEQQV